VEIGKIPLNPPLRRGREFYNRTHVLFCQAVLGKVIASLQLTVDGNLTLLSLFPIGIRDRPYTEREVLKRRNEITLPFDRLRVKVGKAG
jgi:hypothetical protein